MKYWDVTYDGSYLGGSAIVIAETPDEAIELVRNHKTTTNFKDVRADEVNGPVLFNWNGDY